FQRALVVVDRLRKLADVHVHVAELRERIEISRIRGDLLLELVKLLTNGFHRRGGGARRLRRHLRFNGSRDSWLGAGELRVRELRTDEKTADDQAEEETAGGVDDVVACHPFLINSFSISSCRR